MRWLLAPTVAFAAHATASRHAFDQLAQANGWAPAGDVSDSEGIDVSFWLRQTNLDKLAKVVESVSDPTSPNYGHFLSKEEVDTLTAPHEKDIAEVQHVLLPYTGDRAGDGAVITAKVPVEFATRLFGGKFTYYCCADAGAQDCVIRNPTAQVPPNLTAACDIITPLDDPLPPRLPGPIVSGGAEVSSTGGPPRGAESVEFAVSEAAAGCCFSVGFGAFMKPCCLRAFEVDQESACATGRRMGGETSFSKGICPSSAEEAARWLHREEGAAVPAQGAAKKAGKVALGSGPSAAAPLLYAFLICGAALAILLYRQRQSSRQVPLLQSVLE